MGIPVALRFFLPAANPQSAPNGKSCLHSRAFNVKLLVDSKSRFRRNPCGVRHPTRQTDIRAFCPPTLRVKMGPGR